MFRSIRFRLILGSTLITLLTVAVVGATLATFARSASGGSSRRTSTCA